MKTPIVPMALLFSAAGLCACPGPDMPGEDLAPPPPLADMRRPAEDGPAQPMGNIVLVQDGAQRPVPGVDVVVNDGAGAVVQADKTGADGQITVMVPPGGLVAVYQTDGQSRYIDAVSEPPAGLRLTFSSYAPVMAAPAPTQLELTMTGVPAGATQVHYYSACSSGTQGTDVPILRLPACESLGKYDVIAVAMDDGGKRLGWGALLAQTPRPGQTVTGGLPLDRRDFAAIDLEVSGVGAGRRASVRLYPRGDLSRRVASLIDRASALGPPAGRLHAALSLPAVSPEGFRTYVNATIDLPETMQYTFLGSVSRSRYFQTLPAQGSDAVDGLPDVQLAAPDLTDAAHPRYAWQLSLPSRGDEGYLFAEYDTVQGPIFYSVDFPADRKPALRLPDAPPALAAYAVPAAAKHSFAQLGYLDYDGVEGYAEYLDGSKLAASPGYTSVYGTFTLKP